METFNLEGPISKTEFTGGGRPGAEFSWDNALSDPNDDPHFQVQSELLSGETQNFGGFESHSRLTQSAFGGSP